MKKISNGIILYKLSPERVVAVLLAHPGGPIWEKKDLWSIPKGECEPEEDPLSCAKREFEEETGLNTPEGEYLDLGSIEQSSVKTNHIWAVEGSADINQFSSNTFRMEWPPRSGKIGSYPEMDRIEWFTLDVARSKLFPKQIGFLDRLETELNKL